ncbi:MAG: 1,4-alpha-glucan branching protein GlgB [Rhodospirillales bacterium]|nr:1,4-alpha-glucan branching protein GlgB [Rhodospirillales bacterium]
MVSDPETHSADPLSPVENAAIAAGVAKTSALAANDPPLDADDVDRIVQSRHDCPHRVLGPHAAADGSSTMVRAFFPGADHAVLLRTDEEPTQRHKMRCVHPAGLFEARIPSLSPRLDYQFLVVFGNQPPVRLGDPYRFHTTRFTAEDEKLFVAGCHSRLFETLGAWPQVREGTAGVAFGVWAPNAARVSVVGTFNGWDGRRHPMQRVGCRGVWELFVPAISGGELYKFEIKTGEGAVFLKPDPFAARSESAFPSASIVAEFESFRWTDEVWLRDGRLANVNDRGVRAAACDGALPDIPKMPAGYNYLELPAAAAGPGTGGLLVCGTPFESPAALMAWIDACHRRGVGVALATGSGPMSSAAAELAWLDGTRLYEHHDPTGALPPSFDLAKGEVRSILLSSVVFWLERYHVDAFITDAGQALLLGALPDEIHERWPGFRLIIRDPAAPTDLSSREIADISTGRSDDPFAILGPHEARGDPSALAPAEPGAAAGAVIRAMHPEATAVQVLPQATPHLVYEMHALDPAGLFEVRLPAAPANYRLRVFDADGVGGEIVDPYMLRGFAFGAEDQRLFAEGNHYRIYEKLGSHPRCVDGIEGVTFAVWAPEAEGVAVVGSFNGWNGLTHQMARHGISGVWEIFVPGVREGAHYQFKIRARNGHVRLKSDPYAVHTEVPPGTASVVHRLQDTHEWRDAAWLDRRRSGNPWAQPVSIYEVHLGSWMRNAGGRQLSYRELAAKLVPYVRSLGFTHIELMPVAEHPYEPSWGYQVSHFYAATSRFGTPEDLMEFIDLCHDEGIGVILDWVAGHFPKDAHALAWFDGSHLYEHADPRKGEHPDWGTLIFNYGRHEVENFLIANALFWLETYHFDGLRVDAVASMLYLDYSRPAYGGWIPNIYGGNENLDAVEFLKHTNSILHARFPGILMIAEESTSWPNVSRPTDAGGLGFGFKWNMGWMHDTLAYMSAEPSERKYHHGKLTFGITYAFNENFVLSLSHDEVVHMKGSLFDRMPGNEQEKFANLRLMYAFMYTYPGKKLLFMGGEFGQQGEWSHARALEWHLLERTPHRQLTQMLQDLNRLYRSERALFEVDFRSAGFEWLDVDNAEQSIIAFVRKAQDPRNALIIVLNFSAVSRPYYRLGVPYPVAYRQIFSSNGEAYGGFGSALAHTVVRAQQISCAGHEYSLLLPMPALCSVILKPAVPDVSPIPA